MGEAVHGVENLSAPRAWDDWTSSACRDVAPQFMGSRRDSFKAKRRRLSEGRDVRVGILRGGESGEVNQRDVFDGGGE